MAISLETLALAKKMVAKSESQLSGDIKQLANDIAAIKHTTVTVTDDDDGNVTVTIVEPEVVD